MRALRVSLFLTALAIAVIPCTAAVAATTCERWAEVFERETLPTVDELLASLGAGDKSYPDELLALDIYEYRLTGADCRDAMVGKVYATEGVLVGLSTVYKPDYQSRLGRFILEHYDELLVLGDMVAIAGARENCAEYRAVAVTGGGEEVFRISAELYESMVAVGDLPPIPAENARKGYAA